MPGKPRRKSKPRKSAEATAKKLSVQQWRAEALDLRVNCGLSLREIAKKLGKSLGAVHNGIEAALNEVIASKVEDLRRLEGEKLDRDETVVRSVIDAHLPMAVYDGPKGSDLEDDDDVDGRPRRRAIPMRDPHSEAADVVLKAIGQRRSIGETRAKLFGLNAPVKTELTGKDGGKVEIDITGLSDAQLEAITRGDESAVAGDGGTGAPSPKGEPE